MNPYWSLAVVQGSEHPMIERAARDVINWAVLAVELVGALIVLLGVAIAVLHLLPFTRPNPGPEFSAVRLRLASHLLLGFEFLLAADILATAVDPTWEGLGQLAAVAAIRTALNFFLMREMREMRDQTAEKGGKA